MSFKMSGIPFQVFISSWLYLGQMGIGFTISWSGSSISKLKDSESPALSFALSDTQASFVASLLFIGAVPGPYIVGWLSNSKGRKPCLFLGGVLGTIGYLLLATSYTLPMLYCARFLTGLSIGCICPTILVYVGEIASTNIRGILITVLGTFKICGSMLLFSTSPFVSYHTTLYIALALFTTFTLCVLMIPESPMYHILKGNDDALKKILQDLGRSKDYDELVISKTEYRTISNVIDWRDLYAVPSNRKTLFIVLPIHICQASCGFIAVVLFSSVIFETAGCSIDKNICMIIILSFQLFGSGLALIFIENLGRKKLLSVSCIICSITMFLMGVYFYLLFIENPIINNFKWLPLLLLLIFFISYDFGIGVIPYVLICEMFTYNIRSNGAAIALTTAWVTGFLVTTAFGLMVNISIYSSFLAFSVSNALGFLFTVFVIPETKGKNLLKIENASGNK